MTDQTDIAATHLDLGELIRILEAEDPAMVIPLGFDSPHSYRGYYEQLAFEPARDIAIGAMLDAARSALGNTYQGWKGGDYTMRERTPCWLAHHGDTGETIGRTLLRALLAAGRPAIPTPTAADVPDGLSYADVIAQKVADELDRRRDVAEQRMKDMLFGTVTTLDDAADKPIGWTVLLDHWTDQVPPTLFRAKLGTREWAQAEADQLNADPDPGESYRPVAVYPAAEQQPADGLDDPDGPVTRAEQLAVPNAEGWATVYAHRGDHWWAVGPDGRWLPVPGVPDTSGAMPLGWVEIPLRQQPAPAPAASEETAGA